MLRARAMAGLAFIVFAAFLGIAAIKVGRFDLGATVAIGLILAGWDLWTQLGPGRGR